MISFERPLNNKLIGNDKRKYHGKVNTTAVTTEVCIPCCDPRFSTYFSSNFTLITNICYMFSSTPFGDNVDHYCTHSIGANRALNGFLFVLLVRT